MQSPRRKLPETMMVLRVAFAFVMSVCLCTLPAKSQPIDVAAKLETYEQVQTFLARSSFGGSHNNIHSFIGQDAASILKNEMEKAPTLFLDRVLERRSEDGEVSRHVLTAMTWDAIFDGEDQLRMRMMFALSQISVAAKGPGVTPQTTAHYLDMPLAITRIFSPRLPISP